MDSITMKYDLGPANHHVSICMRKLRWRPLSLRDSVRNMGAWEDLIQEMYSAGYDAWLARMDDKETGRFANRRIHAFLKAYGFVYGYGHFFRVDGIPLDDFDDFSDDDIPAKLPAKYLLFSSDQDLDEKILVYLERHPEGLTAERIRARFNVPLWKLESVLDKMVEEESITKAIRKGMSGCDLPAIYLLAVYHIPEAYNERLYEHIVDYLSLRPEPVTVGRLGRRFQIPAQEVHWYVKTLVEKNMVEEIHRNGSITVCLTGAEIPARAPRDIRKKIIKLIGMCSKGITRKKLSNAFNLPLQQIDMYVEPMIKKGEIVELPTEDRLGRTRYFRLFIAGATVPEKTFIRKERDERIWYAYFVEGKNTIQIKNELHHSFRTINRVINAAKNRIPVDKDTKDNLIRHAYFIEGKSVRQVIKECNTSPRRVQEVARAGIGDIDKNNLDKEILSLLDKCIKGITRKKLSQAFRIPIQEVNRYIDSMIGTGKVMETSTGSNNHADTLLFIAGADIPESCSTITECDNRIWHAYFVEGKSINRIAKELHHAPSTVRNVIYAGAAEPEHDAVPVRTDRQD